MAEAYRAHENAAAAVLGALSFRGCPTCREMKSYSAHLEQRERVERLQSAKNNLELAVKNVRGQYDAIGMELLEYILGEVYTPTYLLARPAESSPDVFPHESAWRRELWSVPGGIAAHTIVCTPTWREDSRNKVPATLAHLLVCSGD